MSASWQLVEPYTCAVWAFLHGRCVLDTDGVDVVGGRWPPSLCDSSPLGAALASVRQLGS